MTEPTTEEQIETWKGELATAIAGKQWRVALKLCSWLRYALSQQGLSDPEVEEAQRQAKEALAKQVSREKKQRERKEKQERELRRLQRGVTYQIVSGDWGGALDSIEALHQGGVSQEEVIRLLKELKMRLVTALSPKHRQMDQRSAALGRRFDEVMDRVSGGPLMSKDRPQSKPIDWV